MKGWKFYGAAMLAALLGTALNLLPGLLFVWYITLQLLDLE